MALSAPTMVLAHPSFMEPDIIMSYSQPSGAFSLLPKGQPRTKIAEDDLYVYVKRLDLRTKMASGQAAFNMLPNVTMSFSYISTPTYLTRCRAEWDHLDAARASRWGMAINQGYRLGMRQAHFQLMRVALLYGINPVFGEGIVNAAGATSLNLPADTNGNDTVVTYDNGQMGFFLLQQFGAVKTRTNNIGVGHVFCVLAPQRILAQWEYNVVQLVQYQRIGAGTESTVGLVKGVGEMNEDTILWQPDDTLIGKGSGGNDLVIIVMPELDVVHSPGEIDTNEFAKLTPGFLDNVVMYTDMVAPREITVPLPAGAVDVVSEHRISSGWPIRPEGVELISMQYQ